jgi:photosystem II stability/assembly factor-like uncharacterized protein
MASSTDGSVYFVSLIPGAPADTLGRATTGETGALFAISCATAAACFAAGDFGTVVATSNGGTGWAQQSSGTTNGIGGVSCPSATTCFAVASSANAEIYKTSSGGQAWSVSFTSNALLLGIACPSTSVCFAVGSGSVYGTKDGGVTWAAETAPAPAVKWFFGISCSNTITCIAVGEGQSNEGYFIKTTDGINWSAPALLSTRFSGVSCPTTTLCFATDSGIPGRVFRTTDFGATWTISFNLANDPQAGGTGPFRSIACPSSGVCYAAGDAGLVATTTDAGVNWRTDDVPTTATPTGVLGLTGISCPSVSTCYASSASNILYTADYGGTWAVQFGGVQTLPPGYSAAGYAGLSCPTITTCFAVGNKGIITGTTTAGAAWTRPLPAGPTTLVSGMSCTSNSDCYAVTSNSVLVTHNGGSTWSSQVTPGTDHLLAISCPAANTCFAAGWPGTIYFTGDGGTTWTAQAHSFYGSDNTFFGVSCASATVCVVVGSQGIVLSTTNGNTWAAETSGTTQTLISVSCPNSSSCVAVGNSGLTMTRSGGAWQARASGTTNHLRGVNCPSTSVCYAVGWAGTVLVTQNGGASWTTQTSGTANNLYGISCRKTTACLAVGNSATSVLTVDGSSWSVVSPNGYSLRSAVWQDFNHAWVGGFGGTILANPLIDSRCDSVSASASPPSPSLAGTQVTFTASAAGCPNKLYQFWMRAASQSDWQLLQAYSASPTYNWNSTGAAPGDVYFGVWAKDASSPTGSFDANASIKYTVTTPPPCASVTASAVPASPSSAGTQITFTATATGCGNPRYQFWMRAASQPDWQLLQAYSATPTYLWNSTGAAAGIVYFGVWAKDAGSSTSGFDANASIAYSVTTPSCASLTVSAMPTTVVHGSGTHVTITGAASGCTNTNPLYEFWLRTPTTDWQMIQAYSPTATYDWNTTGAPVTTVYFGVWAKDAKSSTSGFDANASVAVPVT